MKKAHQRRASLHIKSHQSTISARQARSGPFSARFRGAFSGRLRGPCRPFAGPSSGPLQLRAGWPPEQFTPSQHRRGMRDAGHGQQWTTFGTGMLDICRRLWRRFAPTANFPPMGAIPGWTAGMRFSCRTAPPGARASCLPDARRRGPQACTCRLPPLIVLTPSKLLVPSHPGRTDAAGTATSRTCRHL